MVKGFNPAEAGLNPLTSSIHFFLSSIRFFLKPFLNKTSSPDFALDSVGLVSYPLKR